MGMGESQLSTHELFVRRDGDLALRGAVTLFCRVLEWATTERMELTDITDQVNRVVVASGVLHGIAHVQSLHTTTAILISEWQDALLHDIRSYLSHVVRREEGWRHNDPAYSDCDRANADSHLRGILLGQSVSVQIREAGLHLGTWQRLIMAEFDGPRTRSVSVQILGLAGA